MKKSNTFINVDNVWMLNRGHDLNLSSDPDEICFRFNLAFLDCLDGNLQKQISCFHFSFWCLGAIANNFKGGFPQCRGLKASQANANFQLKYFTRSIVSMSTDHFSFSSIFSSLSSHSLWSKLFQDSSFVLCFLMYIHNFYSYLLTSFLVNSKLNFPVGSLAQFFTYFKSEIRACVRICRIGLERGDWNREYHWHFVQG